MRGVGPRSWMGAAVLAAGALALAVLGIGPGSFVPRGPGLELLGELLAAAVRPALDYEAEVPPGTAPFALSLLRSLGMTVLYAAAAMGAAVPLGLALALVSADVAWIRPGASGGRAPAAARALQWSARTLTALLRSVHELVWAVVLLAALGLAPAAAVVAMAIPFAGTIAKVAAELLDEAPRAPWEALEGAGAARVPALLVGLVPAAAGDLASYLFYRFECALRSAAVLGFFGAPTIGTRIQQSFENLQLREMWSYLYGLVALVVLVELLGARLRRALR